MGTADARCSGGGRPGRPGRIGRIGRIGLIVPCRDEAAVIERKLANLAACAWPPAGAPHRVVVVDDHSSDATAERARRHAGATEALRIEVLAGDPAGPGKARAIAAGLRHLAEGPDPVDPVDLVGISDADVVLREDALGILQDAFRDDPSLAMACAAQEFVEDLAEDGTPRGRDGRAPVPAAGLYDRWTARVRRLESRSGRLFSVHGQCLLWRADLGLRPTPGVAADDIDLMLQARGRREAPRGVRLLPAARFLEVKTPPGPDREGQALRRARAYFQATSLAREPLPGWVDRLQLALYRHGPRLAPLFAPVASAVGVVAPVGRRLARLLDVIARARSLEEATPLTDRWEMRRT